MKFIAVLIALLLDKNSPSSSLRGPDPDDWFEFVASRVNGPDVRYVLAVLIPSLVLMWFSHGISNWLFGLVWIALSVVVLLYCIAMVDVEAEYAAAHEQVIDEAAESEDDNQEQPNAAESQKRLFDEINWQTFEGVGPGLFWFVLLGPAGALFYFLNCRYAESAGDEAEELSVPITTVLYWLEWVPVRISLLIFAVLGDFDRTIAYLSDTLSESAGAEEIVSGGISSALGSPRRHDIDTASDTEVLSPDAFAAQERLVGRLAYGWVALVALLTIVGL